MNKTKKIRCAVISSFMGPYYSNYVASILAFEKEMKSRSYTTIYILPKDVENYSWACKFNECVEKVYFIPYKPKSLDNILTIKKIIKNEKISIIYSRMCGWDITGRLADISLPMVWHMDMGVNLTPKSKFFKNWIKYRILALWNTYFIGVNTTIAEAINSLNPRHNCVPIDNALDLSRLRLIHNKQIIVDMPRKILIFAYDPINKGLDKTLDALEKLNEKKIRFNLLVSAQEKTYEYISNRYMTCPKWVTLLPPTDDVSSLYEQSDAMLIPSLSEGFSYCLAEAIYTGLPVVYSDIPGNLWASEFIGTYKCKKGDAFDLSRAICECTSYSMTEEDRENNRQKMNSKYSLNKWQREVVDYIEKIYSDGYES